MKMLCVLSCTQFEGDWVEIWLHYWNICVKLTAKWCIKVFVLAVYCIMLFISLLNVGGYVVTLFISVRSVGFVPYTVYTPTDNFFFISARCAEQLIVKMFFITNVFEIFQCKGNVRSDQRLLLGHFVPALSSHRGRLCSDVYVRLCQLFSAGLWLQCVWCEFFVIPERGYKLAS